MSSIRSTVEASGQRGTASRPFLSAVTKKVPFSLADVQVVSNVPYFKRKASDSSKWEPLFAKLQKAGQSCAVPAHCHGGIGAAIAKRNRLKKPEVFKISKESADTSRLFRIA